METKVTHVQVTFTKDEMLQMIAMFHDSTCHWRKHLANAEEDSSYYLESKGCKAVLDNAERMYREVKDLYDKHFN